MTLLETFDYLNNSANDRSWWPVPVDSLDSIPLLTAAVRLSGRMDECRNGQDLEEAVEHTLSLIRADVILPGDVSLESCRIEEVIEAEMQRIEAQLNAITQSN